MLSELDRSAMEAVHRYLQAQLQLAASDARRRPLDELMRNLAKEASRWGADHSPAKGETEPASDDASLSWEPILQLARRRTAVLRNWLENLE